MAIESAAIAKIGVGLIAVGGASGGIYAYKDAIASMWNADNKSFLVQVTENVTNFEKDYVCFSNSDTEKKNPINCTISSINIDKTKKHISTDDLKENNLGTIKAKEDLKQNSYYHPLIDLYQWTDKEKLSSSTANLSIFKKDGKTEFAKLKVIASLDKNDKNKRTEKIEYFLGKVDDIKQGSTAAESYTIASGTTFNCTFDEVKKDAPDLACQIHKFNDTQSATDKNFSGSLTALTDNGTIDKTKYYLIKITANNGVEWNTFNGKDVFYSQTSQASDGNKHVITFKETTPVIVSTEGTNNNLLLIK